MAKKDSDVVNFSDVLAAQGMRRVFLDDEHTIFYDEEIFVPSAELVLFAEEVFARLTSEGVSVTGKEAVDSQRFMVQNHYTTRQLYELLGREKKGMGGFDDAYLFVIAETLISRLDQRAKNADSVLRIFPTQKREE